LLYKTSVQFTRYKDGKTYNDVIGTWKFLSAGFPAVISYMISSNLIQLICWVD